MKHIKIDGQNQRLIYIALLSYSETAKDFCGADDLKRIRSLLKKLRPLKDSTPTPQV